MIKTHAQCTTYFFGPVWGTFWGTFGELFLALICGFQRTLRQFILERSQKYLEKKLFLGNFWGNFGVTFLRLLWGVKNDQNPRPMHNILGWTSFGDLLGNFFRPGLWVLISSVVLLQ